MKSKKTVPIEIQKEDVGARQKIIDAATVLFAEQGLHGVSTRDIAKKSGMNLSLISYYFGGKEGLYRTVMEEFANLVYEEISALLDKDDKSDIQSTNIKKSILGVLDIFLKMRKHHPAIAKIMVREKLNGSPFEDNVVENSFMRVGDKLKTIIVNGQRAGVIKKEINPDFFFFCLAESFMAYFNMLDFNPQWAQKCYPLSTQNNELKDQMILIFLEGILK